MQYGLTTECNPHANEKIHADFVGQNPQSDAP